MTVLLYVILGFEMVSVLQPLQ